MLWIVALTTSAAAQCAGWDSSPVARAACCHAAGHSCPQRGSADDCCAQSEQNHQSFTATPMVAVVKPVTFTVAILDLLAIQSRVEPVATAARAFEAQTLTVPHESPHLVFSVFRI